MRALVVLALLATGCATVDPSQCGVACAPDMAMTDGSDDLLRSYQAATIHAIDTGGVKEGSDVRLSGVVLISPVEARTASMSRCTYQGWVQDPSGVAPSGIGLFVLRAQDSGACPAVPASGTVWDAVAPGDNVDVLGRVLVSTFTGAGGSITQHSIALDQIVKVAGNRLVTPTTVNDPAQFRSHAAGFNAYEGMLVELRCMTGADCAATSNQLRVASQPSPYIWTTTGGAQLGSLFQARWPGRPGANGTAYASIVGVVNSFLGGTLEPRAATDFK
jgi:hypothetical protein